jgi:hypothetical protein
MFTIRNLVEMYTNKKCDYLNKNYSEIINSTALCLIFETNNGTECFIDMHPEMDYTSKSEFKYQRPNSRNVFKKFDFEIVKGNPIFPQNMKAEPWILNDYCLFTVEPTKEKIVNEFISLNGGINVAKLKENIDNMYS